MTLSVGLVLIREFGIKKGLLSLTLEGECLRIYCYVNSPSCLWKMTLKDNAPVFMTLRKTPMASDWSTICGLKHFCKHHGFKQNNGKENREGKEKKKTHLANLVVTQYILCFFSATVGHFQCPVRNELNIDDEGVTYRA